MVPGTESNVMRRCAPGPIQPPVVGTLGGTAAAGVVRSAEAGKTNMARSGPGAAGVAVGRSVRTRREERATARRVRGNFTGSPSLPRRRPQGGVAIVVPLGTVQPHRRRSAKAATAAAPTARTTPGPGVSFEALEPAMPVAPRTVVGK